MQQLVRKRARSAGLTVVEVLVVVAIIGILLSVGMPAMSNWLVARQGAAAAEFYRDAFTVARNTALSRNANSRVVFSTNATNGQPDWRVDICFANNTVCDDVNGSWSTTTTRADADPDQNGGFLSIARSAEVLPGTDALTVTQNASDATATYFTPLGWINPNVAPAVRGIRVEPATARAGAFNAMEVRVTLAGVTSICDPAAVGTNPKRCLQ